MASRGGLCQPTELCFGVTSIAVQYYSTIICCDRIEQALFRCKNQQSVFLNAVRDTVWKLKVMCSLLDTKCESGHVNFDLIIQTAFNCFAKNEPKRFDSKPSLGDPPKKDSRRIRKLASKTSKD